jgi:hypothetical protein
VIRVGIWSDLTLQLVGISHANQVTGNQAPRPLQAGMILRQRYDEVGCRVEDNRCAISLVDVLCGAP